MENLCTVYYLCIDIFRSILYVNDLIDNGLSLLQRKTGIKPVQETVMHQAAERSTIIDTGCGLFYYLVQWSFPEHISGNIIPANGG